VTDDVTDRLRVLDGRIEGPPRGADLPEGYTDTVAYLTDEEGDWDDLRYARLLLETHGPPGPAWAALRELEEVERALAALETEYLRLRELARSEREDGSGPGAREARREGIDREEGGDWREAERIANRIAADRHLDRRLFDSIRAQLVALSDPDRTPPEQRS